MQKVLITRDIRLAPQFIDQFIMKHLYTVLIDKITNTCSRQFGHIIKINNIISIEDQYIDRFHSDIHFIVKFEATTLLPTPGLETTGEICMVYEDGIFVNIQSLQKLLIPSCTLSDYNFNASENYFSNGVVILNKNKIITIKITDSKYQDGKFSCLGVFKE